MARIHATGISTRYGSGSVWTLGSSGVGVAWRIDGIENVTRNINEVLMGMKLKSAEGLLAAANYVLTDADSGTPPLVPELTGQLRNSRFANAFKKPVSGDPYVIFGYRANYAAAVHEMMQSPSGKPINWTRPGSGPKFFQASLTRNAKKIPAIVAKHTKK